MSDQPIFAPEFHSTVEGIDWPAIAGRDGRRLLAVLFQLEQSQWWAPEVLLEHQLRQAGALVRHAYKTVPFYRERLERADFDPRSPMDSERWAGLPILTREEVQDAGERIHSTRVPRGHGKVLTVQTSGSTGRPVRGLLTELSAFLCNTAVTMRGHFWQRRDFTRKLGVIRDFKGKAAGSREVSLPYWSPAVNAIVKSGPCVAHNINAVTVDRLIEWMRHHDPAYLLCFPTMLGEMARLCMAKGIRFPNLLEITAIGEAVTPEIRAACREAWDVPLVDAYSSQEIGTMALQCPDHEHYHVQAESVLLEILDDDGRPAAPGELGRVVVTALHNFAMPFIRYAIGDCAEVGGAPCACGRGLPVVESFVGRVRNLIVLPSGQRLRPGHTSATFTDVAPIRQFQLIQTAPAEMTVKVVVDPPLGEAQKARISENLRAIYGYPVNFTFEHMDEIPRSPAGKFEDFMVAFDA